MRNFILLLMIFFALKSYHFESIKKMDDILNELKLIRSKK